MKKFLQIFLKNCLLLLLVGAFSHQSISAAMVDTQAEDAVSGLPASQISALGKQSSSAVSSADSVAKLEENLSSLLLKRVADFVKPLVSALKPATMELLSVTAQEVMKTLLANQTFIDPEIVGILKEPTLQLISLTKDAAGMLAGMPATSVDDWFAKLDSLKDELVGHLKILGLTPGSNADEAVKKILKSVTSLENVMNVFQGDIATELKKRIEAIKKPISAAAGQLLAGLPPETVERLLVPLKALQGDIAQALKGELDSFKKVIFEKLPQSLLQTIKLKTKLLVEKIQEDPSMLPSNLRRAGELLLERIEIFANPVEKIPGQLVKAMRRDLEEIRGALSAKNKSDVEGVAADLTRSLDDAAQMIPSIPSADMPQATAQPTAPKKGFLGSIISRVKKDISSTSREVVGSITGGAVIDAGSGEKPSALFSDLSDGSIIAIRSYKESPGQGRYLSVIDGRVKPVGTNKTETAAQFIVARFGNFLGLKSKATGKFLTCNPTTFEITCLGKDFYSDTADAAHFVPVGNKIDKMWLKNNKANAFLSVRKPSESWSHGGSVMARDGDGKPAKATNWGRFAIDIIKQPNEPLAASTQSLNLLPAGVMVAIKSLKDPANPRYLAVDLSRTKDKFFVRATGTSKDDPACQFYVVRNDNWLGFKTQGWKSLCAEPVMHRVKFIERSDTLASSIEHWELHPEKDGSLKNVWLQNRSSQGYLTVPDGKWANNLVWTAFTQTKNPLADSVKGAPKFIMQPAGRGDNGRFEIEIIKAIPDDVQGGGSTFTFLPAYHGKNEIQFNRAWKFPAGDLELVLKDIQAEGNVYINLSPVMGKSSASLRILLGREKNSSSSIRFGDDELLNVKDASGVVVKSPAAFWIRLKDGELSLGKGVEFGTGLIGQVKIDKAAAANISYMGLGGSIEPVVYRSVSMNKAPEEKPVVVAPVIPEPKAEPIISAAPAIPEPKVEEPIVPITPAVIELPKKEVVPEVVNLPAIEPEPALEKIVIPAIPLAPEAPKQKPRTRKVAKKPAKRKKAAKKKGKKPAKRKKVAKKKKPAPKKRATRLAKPQKGGTHRMEIQSAQWVAGDRKTDRREVRTKRMLARQKRQREMSE